MSDQPPGETTQDLLAAARAAGFQLSQRQIAEWHRKGFLPEPQRVWLGRGHGSVSVYPPGTGEQLVRLCQYKERFPHDMDQVAWALWWDGYQAPFERVRLRLQQATDAWAQGTQEIKELFWEKAECEEEEHLWLSEALLDQLDRAASKRLTHKFLAHARKRLGRNRFDTFGRVLLEVVIGEFKGFRDSAHVEERLVETGLGLQRARTDRMLNVDPWLQDSIEPALIRFSEGLRDKPLGHNLGALTEMDLAQARDEVRLFMQLVSGISHMLEFYFGKYAFGLSAAGHAIQEMRPADQAMWLLGWIDMRSWGLGEDMNVFIALAQQGEALRSRAVQILQLLASEVPETAATLDPKRLGAGFKSQTSWDTLLAELHALYLRHEEPITAFWARHPELAIPEPDALPPPGEQQPPSEDLLITTPDDA